MQNWAEWQLNYIHGLFVIWPPDPIREQINELRDVYDPVSQDTIEAHITLTQPFLARPGGLEWARLAEIAADFEPFEVSYGPVNTFFPNPVIYLEIRPRERILALRQALHETGLFNLTLPYTDDFVPHMTIAESRSDKVVDEKMLAQVMSLAPQGTFLTSEIACMVPDSDFHFELSKRLVLAGRQS